MKRKYINTGEGILILSNLCFGGGIKKRGKAYCPLSYYRSAISLKTIVRKKNERKNGGKT